ncbi:MAG: PEP-CTERM sorting domain-containing protein [bacterium]
MLFICALVISLGIIGMANATVLTFDDITTATGYTSINNYVTGYGGFMWDQDWYLMHTPSYSPQSSGYISGTASGDYILFNAYASVVSINDADFDFNGAYLTAAWNTDLNIRVRGFDDGVQIYEQIVTTDTNGPNWFDFDFLGIDQLEFYSYGGISAGIGGSGEHFAMDDFTVNESVPEPATCLLLLFGFAGMVGIKKKFS